MDGEGYNSTEPRPFRVCERCGQLTPGSQPQCVNCGAVSPDAAVAEEERAEQRFAQAFFSRATPVTYALLAVNVGIFLLMWFVSGGTDDPAVLIAFGAKTNELLQSGDWYRLITPIFIHAGLIHLLSNSYALWMVGPQVERLYGSARFLLIYLLAGVGGVVGSYIGQQMLNKPAVPSVGASGAIFGLFGVLAVFGFRYRSELPPAFRRAFGAGVLPVIAINLVIGFSIPFIDNSAHIGGLATGAVLTFIVPYIAPGRERVSRIGLLVTALCLAVIVYSFAQAYRESGEHVGWRESIVSGYLDAINSAQKAVIGSFSATTPGSEKKEAVAALIEAVDKLRQARSPNPQADQIREDLLRIVRRQHSLITSSATRDRNDELEANYDEYQQVDRRLRKWVESVGSKHGLTWKDDEKQSK